MAFDCSNLDLAQAAAVFPLVREAAPGLTLKAWLNFARRHAHPRRARQGGIVVVRRRPRPHPCGLFVYRREIDLTRGPVLVAEHVVAVDLLDPAPVMDALLAEMEALARRLDCTAIRTVVLAPERLQAERLAGAGHHVEGEMRWKEICKPGVPGGCDPVYTGCATPPT